MVYPVGGLSPLLLGRHHRLASHSPAPVDFEVVHGDVWLLGKSPVERGRHQAVSAHCHVSDLQAGRAGWSGGVCGKHHHTVSGPFSG